MQKHIAQLIREKRGHFEFESGHHGEIWLELELLFLHPERVHPVAVELAERIRACKPQAICGPLEEGAFLAMLVAMHLSLPFCYSCPVRSTSFTTYRVPNAQASELVGLKVAVIDDVVNAGSAVSGTITSLRQSGAVPIAIGAMAVYGKSAAEIAAENGLVLEALVTSPSRIWEPGSCPLCAEGVPINPRA